MKSQEIANILIAVLAVIAIGMCWDSNGSRLFQTGLMCGGVFIGYIMTTYLNKGEEE